MKLRKFEGCGKCPLAGEEFDCVKNSVPVNVTFKNDEKADNWGNIATVFRKGETVKGYAVVKDDIGYCVIAESNIYDGYEDFVSTDNIKVETMD